MFCTKTFSNPNSKNFFIRFQEEEEEDYEVPKSFVVVFVFFTSIQKSLCRDVTGLRSLLCTDAPSPQMKGGGRLYTGYTTGKRYRVYGVKWSLTSYFLLTESKRQLDA